MATADILHERTSERLAVGPIVEKLMRPLASLKLTVSLLAMSVFIVLAGTMAQVDKDIWEVVDKYFRCGIAWIPLQIFFPPSFFPSKPQIPGVIPFPGGWTIGTLMFLNLIAAHGLRFVPQAKGGRLWGGVGVISLGFLATWMVVVSGSNPDGIQHEGWLTWDSIWLLFKLGLSALFIGLIAWMTRMRTEAIGQAKPVDRIQNWAALTCGVLLGVTTLWLWLKGEDAQLDDSSMRILWQLVKGTFAGLVLLVGCVLIFKKRAGVVLLHGGIGLMMLSELLVGVTAVESQISLLEGERTNFARDIRNFELAVVEANGVDEETHVVLPGKKLLASQDGDKVAHELLPFDVKVVSYFKNADVRRKQDGDAEKNPATEGLGTVWTAEVAEASTGTDSGGKVDYPAAYVKLTKRGTDELIGTYLVSVLLSEEGRADQVKVGDKTHDLSLRFTRHYKPYTVELKDVRKDDYLGTDTPRNYSSDIRVVNESAKQEFDYHVWMNNPLRYSGETFYQSGYHKVPTTGIEGTSLQVVTNTGWMIPYVACMIVAVGLLTHFSVTLLRFLDRRNRGTVGQVYNLPGSANDGKLNRNRRQDGQVENLPQQTDATLFWIPVIAVTVLGLWVGSKARVPNVKPDEFDYAAFGQLPIVDGGRVKPIDTYARNTLRIISGKETFKLEDKADPKQTTTQPAIHWLLDVIARPNDGQRHKVVRIDNPEVIKALGLERRKGFLYAPNEFTNLADEKEKDFSETRLGKVSVQADQARDKGPKNMSVTERKIIEFERKFGMHDTISQFIRIPDGDDKNPEFDLLTAHRYGQALTSRKMPLVIPPRTGTDTKSQDAKASDDWLPFSLAAFLNPIESRANSRELAKQLADVVDRVAPMMQAQMGAKDMLPIQRIRLQRELKQNLEMQEWLRKRYLAEGAPATLEENPAVAAWRDILTAYSAGNAREFNAQVARYHGALEGRRLPEVSLTKVGFESFFNYFQPFFLASMSYFMVFIVATLAWLGWTKTLNRTAFWMICFTLLLHTFALVSRIYISGRPPVTNLYSSAVFISWGTVVLGLVLECIFRLGIGNVVAAVTGFAGLLIAHYLAADGDTFTVLQAVLDTQFWLATHVTTINLGYATVFLAGMMGVLYVLRGFFTKSLTPDVEKNLARMIYGTLCFGIFFSFVGTVLGGLWADDSWGRFWGWDPKENGALIIVLWTALVLHARWGGMVKDRGMAVLAIGGNIATSWSWFGVNELGVGLHSYGFTEGVLLSLGVFVISQLAAIFIGCLPRSMWASFRSESVVVDGG